MNRTEHLLVILMEECDEVSQRVAKALRFGLSEKQTGQQLTNAERVISEVHDLLAALEMLATADALPHFALPSAREAIDAKKEKVRRYLNYSREFCGTLTD